jgi:hypothetical protein
VLLKNYSTDGHSLQEKKEKKGQYVAKMRFCPQKAKKFALSP